MLSCKETSLKKCTSSCPKVLLDSGIIKFADLLSPYMDLSRLPENEMTSLLMH